MKTITIGRGEGCHIYIDDELMSRRHAIIKIPTFGGMEIVDMSKNGTFVNGVRLRPNVPFPVKRTDVVNFADVAQLDWSQVPNPMKYYKLGAAIVGGLVVLLLAIFLLKNLLSTSEEPSPKPATEQIQQSATPIGQQTKPVVEEPAQEQDESKAEPQSPAATEGQEAQSDTYDPVKEFNKAVQASKDRREAEERARQQKAREQKAKEQKAKEQQQKEQQQKEQQKEQQKQPDSQKQEDGKPSDGGSSGKKEYKPEMI
ncbi:MAG: FHA domain-containing protein [Prevotella sp.]|nr:FHA domain-containing protein [Prevotella sp.]